MYEIASNKEASVATSLEWLGIEDWRSWKLTKNGAFDIRSFYNKLRSPLPIIFPWKGAWKRSEERRVGKECW